MLSSCTHRVYIPHVCCTHGAFIVHIYCIRNNWTAATHMQLGLHTSENMHAYVCNGYMQHASTLLTCLLHSYYICVFCTLSCCIYVALVQFFCMKHTCKCYVCCIICILCAVGSKCVVQHMRCIYEYYVQ